MNGPILKAIQAVLSVFPEIEIAILYGSFAKGTEKPTSDLDLGVAALQVLSLERLVEIQTKISNSTSREVDLIDLQTATGTVFKEALTNGKLLFKRDDALYANILRRLMFEQADFEPIRSSILEERRKQVLG